MRRRRQIRIAHAQIDNVLSRTTGRRTHRINFSDNIRRQTLDAVKFFGHWLPFPLVDYRAALMREVFVHFHKKLSAPGSAGSIAFSLMPHAML
jgi:hypothetical protein